ncbi:MAG TPA: Rne/Rng family ribonuclease [Candidatus Hydrogenedentes bacterium]|nr:Rne/Rng family ribonuclease [Candidatus Hydrogenedentota bacterium]
MKNNSLYVNVSPMEIRIALIEENRLAELVIEREENRSLVGNIYRGRIDAILPGIQAAFVDIGEGKNGFLYVSDIAGTEGTGDIELVDGVPRARTKAGRARQQPIESMLKRDQFIMVQVVKDSLGTKGPRLTNFITLPGRYVVLMPTVKTLGVSHKIESGRERERIKRILREIRPEGMGLIGRTACEDAGEDALREDVAFLTRAWEEVKRKYERTQRVTLLREDLGPILRYMRDRLSDEHEQVIVDDEFSYEKVLSFLDQFAPKLRRRVKLYTGREPLFEKEGIEEEISKALRRTVPLKSGGYICIDQTEALVAIDVNTGRFTGKKHLEETVLQTNLEAAEEIARQVRLRDMGGIIVIDFIDMEVPQNRRKLMETFTAALKRDHAKYTLSEISELGMIEMTRKRVKHNLVKMLSQPCPYCEGSGMVRSVTTVTFDVLRRLQSLFCRTREQHVILQVHPDIAERFQGENAEHLNRLCAAFDRQVTVEPQDTLHIHDWRVLKARSRQTLNC